MERLGEKFSRQAKESQSSAMATLQQCAELLMMEAIALLQVQTTESGLDYVLVKIDSPEAFPMIYGYRDVLVGKCLDCLPIDILCSIEASDPVTQTFVLRIGAVEPYEGGAVDYDFPVWSENLSERSGRWHNLEHLLRLDSFEGEELVLLEAFRILVESAFSHRYVRKWAFEWGMEHPQVIVDLTDQEGFFEQFKGGLSPGLANQIEIKVDPFVGGSQ